MLRSDCSPRSHIKTINRSFLACKNIKTKFGDTAIMKIIIVVSLANTLCSHRWLMWNASWSSPKTSWKKWCGKVWSHREFCPVQSTPDRALQITFFYCPHSHTQAKHKERPAALLHRSYTQSINDNQPGRCPPP